MNSKLKEKEIRFSKFHDLQVDNLQKLYSKLIDLSYANRNLFSAREESNNHLELRKRIRKWDRKYIEVHYFFHQNRILFNKEVNKEMSNRLDEFQKVRNLLLNNDKDLEEIEELFNGNFNEMYEFEDNELVKINDRIKKLREMDIVSKTALGIKSLSSNIEEKFRKITR